MEKKHEEKKERKEEKKREERRKIESASTIAFPQEKEKERKSKIVK